MQQIATRTTNALFVGDECCRFASYRSARQEGATEAEVRAFPARGMPPERYAGPIISPVLPLAASPDRRPTLVMMRTTPLKPCSKRICCRGSGLLPGKAEAHATRHSGERWPCWTRDAIAAMWDELEEENEE